MDQDFRYNPETIPVRKLDEADPIWGEVADVRASQLGSWIVNSARSGSYICGSGLRESLSGWDPAAKARLTTWILDQNRAGEPFARLLPDALSKAYGGSSLRYTNRVARFFEYLNRRGYRPGEPIVSTDPNETTASRDERHRMMRWIEAATDSEFVGFIIALQSQNLVSDGSVYSSRLTGEGLLRLEAADAAGVYSDQAFVAMWFSMETKEAYEDGIELGLADAGYRALRIDRKEHANKIDDEIVAEIRKSRFLVADFTSGVVGVGEDRTCVPRGGVYFEAGLAQGLGMPVIWTVRADQINDIHFDIRQYNQITWSTPSELREKLYRRVAAVLGHYRQSH